jgi:hypothetical protein
MYAREDIFCFLGANLLTYDFNFVHVPRVTPYLFGQSNRYRASRLNPVLTEFFTIDKSALLGKIAVSAEWFAVHITLLTDGGRSVRVTIAASLVDSIQSTGLELLRAKHVLKLSPGGF